MKRVLLICTCTVLLASCGQQSADYKRLKAENDSLKIENEKNSEDLNEMLSILNDVETDIQSIREAENFLTIQQHAGSEENASKREQIKQNMQLITETLKKNREQINELQEKLLQDKLHMKTHNYQYQKTAVYWNRFHLKYFLYKNCVYVNMLSYQHFRLVLDCFH